MVIIIMIDFFFKINKTTLSQILENIIKVFPREIETWNRLWNLSGKVGMSGWVGRD